MKDVVLSDGRKLPLELHKVKIVQKLNLPSAEDRKKNMEEAGFNTFLLKNRDVFLDMLTDSGVNAMSDLQQAAMLTADDSYAGSETFYRLRDTLEDIFGTKYFLPAHQGRACENILASVFVSKGQCVPMNYHFTTTKAHITRLGGEVIEIPTEEAYKITSDAGFKGNMDIDKLKAVIDEKGKEKIAFVRMEAGTNLIGGQPFSLDNLRKVSEVTKAAGVLLVLDASLLGDNLHFLKQREDICKNMEIKDIMKELADHSDIVYFSARKLGAARGGAIITSNEGLFERMKPLVPLFEGFLTYGGMSVKEMEAINQGLKETLDEDNISQGPQFIEFMTQKLIEKGVPVVTPAGGLGCHLDALKFLPNVPQNEYTAGALAAAIYIISGVRGMERGTLSEQRDKDGNEPLADMELVRLALPRRVFTMSQVLYAVDRIAWLFENRDLVGGLEWKKEPEILRFFFGHLQPKSDWPNKLVKKFKEDFGEEL